MAKKKKTCSCFNFFSLFSKPKKNAVQINSQENPEIPIQNNSQPNNIQNLENFHSQESKRSIKSVKKIEIISKLTAEEVKVKHF